MVWDPTYGGQIAPQNTTPTNFARDPRVPVTPPTTTPRAAAMTSGGPFTQGQAVGGPSGWHICLVGLTYNPPPAANSSNNEWKWSLGAS
jgi:hypothetical protein